MDFMIAKQDEISEIKAAVTFISKQSDLMRLECEEDRKEIATLKKENSDLKERVERIEHQADCNQQYSCRNCLVFHGIPESSLTTDMTIINEMREKLNINIEPSDLGRTHRLPSTKLKPIIVKFTRYNTRNLIFMNKKRLKHLGISITESLTCTRVKALKAAQEE